MEPFIPIKVNRIAQFKPNKINSHSYSTDIKNKTNILQVKKRETYKLISLTKQNKNPFPTIKVSLRTEHRKNLSQILLDPAHAKKQKSHKHSVSSMTTNQSNEFSSSEIKSPNYTMSRNTSRQQKSIDIKNPRRHYTEDNESVNLYFSDRKVRCSSSQNSFSFGGVNNSRSSGLVDISQIPVKRERSFCVEKKKVFYSYQHIRSVMLIQSFVRQFLCRKRIYSKLINFYKLEAFFVHLRKIFHKKLKKIFLSILFYKKRKYYASRKELDLINYLNQKGIYKYEDFWKYVEKLKSDENGILLV